MTQWLKRPASVEMLVVATGVVCALLLALPGETVTTKYLNDLFIFLDGVHRVSLGQVPNRDFHTALGPLVYYVPAIGYWLTGSFGGAMPVGMGLLVLGFALIAAHVVGSRLRPAIGLPVALFLILVTAVPANLGEGIRDLSFAMFYNRIGWSGLGLLLIMYLQPVYPHRRQAWLDAVCASALLLLLFYMKISYGVVGLAFMVFMLLFSRQRLWVAAALAVTIVIGLAVEASWGATKAHFDDLLLAGEVSGRIDQINELAEALFRNLADYVLFTVFTILVLWRTRSLRDFLFLGFCAGSGFMIINQNFQHWGVITLGAGAAVAAEILARTQPAAPKDGKRPLLSAGAPLLLLALLLPSTVHMTATLGLHAGLAATRYGQSVPLPNFEQVRLARLWSEGEHPAFSRYLGSIADGARALDELGEDAGHVLVLDFVGPFSAGLGLQPPQGDSTWYHWGRTLDDDHHLPAEEVFRDVRVVMDPKWAIESWTAEGLRRVYADHLTENYELLRETADWKVYILRDEPAETVSRSRDLDGDPTTAEGSSPTGG
ncbi:hypothetical protein [Microvirga lenta]|uniref:hypothetical protein n=1 Tax=Microvirga lenta TaxID=2881337 RepID=UPI001CFF962C|nr:hypothetical protein [Microvirga lenta]MCB5175729.1 hypothetical protein [Microvirga lenta]